MSGPRAHRLQRPLRAAPPHRARRHGRRVPRPRPAARPAGGGEGPVPGVRHRPVLRRALPAEATAAANLNHPNIVGVYDWGEADGTYFIVMEYVDGRTLSEILRDRGPAAPRPGRRRRRRRRRRPRLRPPQRRRAPRREAGQRAHHPGRPGEGGRLRHRPGHHRQRRAGEPHPGRRGHGHRHLLLARAGPGRRRRPPQRHLLPRLRALRDGGGAAAVHRRLTRWPSPTSTCRSRPSRPGTSTSRLPRPSRPSSSSAWPRTR